MERESKKMGGLSVGLRYSVERQDILVKKMLKGSTIIENVRDKMDNI